jgi:3-oxoacyl-[acyl-carrier-protein] synthase II
MNKRRVVVTGLGMISPIGSTVDTSWRACKAGESGIVRIKEYKERDYPSQICGVIPDFDPGDVVSAKDRRKMDPFSQYALVASDEAWRDSGLILSPENANRFGVAIGSGIGGINSIIQNHEKFQEGGARKVSPFFIPASIINMAAGNVSIRFGLKGPNISIVTACTTGTHNIGIAARLIQYGDADVMLAGGTEMATSDLCINGFAATKALSRRNNEPTRASRPWDEERDGFVLSEGAGVLVLEEYQHAKKRGANIYAELKGVGFSADAYHITLPSGDGGTNCMTNALHDAKMNVDQIHYLNAHATSTTLGDKIEIESIKEVFGDYSRKIAISSTKSMTGHLLGAAGAVEAIFSVLAIRDNVAPPTINLDNPSEGCDLNLVAHTAQERTIDVAISNSFGFGGTNASVIFSRLT